MKKFAIVLVSLCLGFSTFTTGSSVAAAAKVGSSCKKLNAKDWDGNNPIVCKKNSLGKLTWTIFGSPSQATKSYNLTIGLILKSATAESSDPNAVQICNGGLFKYPDITSSTGVEIRDGNANLIGTTSLGDSTVVDVEGSRLSSCAFKATIKLKKSNFYQIKIGTRYDKSFSFSELEKGNWFLGLTIG
jgi:hypothetical protein